MKCLTEHLTEHFMSHFIGSFHFKESVIGLLTFFMRNMPQFLNNLKEKNGVKRKISLVFSQL